MDEIEFASEGSVTFLCTDEDASVYMKILLNNEWVENRLNTVFVLFLVPNLWFGDDESVEFFEKSISFIM